MWRNVDYVEFLCVIFVFSELISKFAFNTKRCFVVFCVVMRWTSCGCGVETTADDGFEDVATQNKSK